MSIKDLERLIKMLKNNGIENIYLRDLEKVLRGVRK